MPCDFYKTSEKNSIQYVKKFVAQHLKFDFKQVEVFCLNTKIQDQRDLFWVNRLLWHEATLKKLNVENQTFTLHYALKSSDVEMKDETKAEPEE